MGQINDLEQIGKGIDAPAVDDSTASKIEMTRKRPSEYPVPEKAPGTEPAPLSEQREFGDAAVAEPTFEHGVPSEEVIAETIPEPCAEATAGASAKVSVEAVVVTETAVTVETVSEPAATSTKLPAVPVAIDAAILVVGGACLATPIALVTGGSMDQAVGWVPTIIGSFLVVLAISRLLALREKSRASLAPTTAPAEKRRLFKKARSKASK